MDLSGIKDFHSFSLGVWALLLEPVAEKKQRYIMSAGQASSYLLKHQCLPIWGTEVIWRLF